MNIYDQDTFTAKVSREEALSATDDTPETKPRLCLMCSTEFLSEWAGERICRKCKSSTKWRNG
jgi:hypothetical protein